MDEDNTFITDKTRCPACAQKAFSRPGPKEFAPLVDWLKGAAGAPRTKSPLPQIDIGNNLPNTRAAAQYVAEEKIARGTLEARAGAPWKTMREVAEAFQAVRERVGEVVWREQVERCGWREYQDIDIRNAMDSRDAATKAMAKENSTGSWMRWRARRANKWLPLLSGPL